MSVFKNTAAIEAKEVAPGFHGKMIHMEGMTVAHFFIEKGSALPAHQHPHEQVTNIISGEFEMTVGAETKLCKAGDVVCIPSNVPHFGKALTDVQVIDVFQPVREDYR